MNILCLTGGIATGKSTVANMFTELGAPLIDTDILAREVLDEDKEAIRQVREAYGPSVIDENGRIDRKALAKRIFDDESSRSTLNRIVHPRVRTLVNERIRKIMKKSEPRLIVVDVPLLFESGFDDVCDFTLTVYIDKDTQLERLIKRDNISTRYARKKMAAQMPLEQKKARSDYVIDNSKDLESTRFQVKDIFQKAGDA